MSLCVLSVKKVSHNNNTSTGEFRLSRWNSKTPWGHPGAPISSEYLVEVQ